MIGAGSADQHQVQAARAVRAVFDGLLDVGGLGRPGNEVHAARHRPVLTAQTIPGILHACEDSIGAQYDDVVIRQVVETGRRHFAGDEHQRAGFGNTEQRRGHADEVATLRLAVARRQRIRPLDVVDQRFIAGDEVFGDPPYFLRHQQPINQRIQLLQMQLPD